MEGAGYEHGNEGTEKKQIVDMLQQKQLGEKMEVARDGSKLCCELRSLRSLNTTFLSLQRDFSPGAFREICFTFVQLIMDNTSFRYLDTILVKFDFDISLNLPPLLKQFIP